MKQSKITLVRLVLRVFLTLSVLFFYFTDRTLLDFDADRKLLSFSMFSSPLLTTVWIFLATDLILRLFPLPYTAMGAKKSFSKGFKARPSALPLKRDRTHFKKMQRDALRATVVYLLVNGLYFLPYLFIRHGIWKPSSWTLLPDFFTEFLSKIGPPELLVAVMLYYIADIFFIRFWCIFRNVVNKNRCCTTCRIHCWDSVMCLTPLLLCPQTFFSSTLLFLAFLSFVRHEISFYTHPWRFNEKQNELLSCASCTNDVCPRKMCGKKR